MAILTHHAMERAKQRIGLSKKAVQRQAEKALEHGILHKEVTGSFRRFLDRIYLKDRTATNMRVYGEYIYLFTKENVLITVYHVPNKYKKIVKKMGDKCQD